MLMRLNPMSYGVISGFMLKNFKVLKVRKCTKSKSYFANRVNKFLGLVLIKKPDVYQVSKFKNRNNYQSEINLLFHFVYFQDLYLKAAV